MIVFTSHRELQEAIDKTLLAYGTYQSDRMRTLMFEHLTKLFAIQVTMMQMVIKPAEAK